MCLVSTEHHHWHLRELELPAAAAAGAGRPGHVPGTPRGLEAMRGGWWHGVRPVPGRGGRARGGGRPGSTGAWSPQAEQPLDGGPGGDVSRKDAAGRRGSWIRGPGPSPRHGPQRGPRGQQPRARGAADGWKLSKGGGRGDGGTTGPRRGGDVWAGDRRGTCRGGAASCRRRAASSRCRGDSGSRRGRTAPPASCGRGHRGGGVGARGPGGQRRGRRSATTPPRGRGNQAVAGASAVPRVLARSTAEPSRTLADSGDCISGTARNRRPTPSYSASIVGS